MAGHAIGYWSPIGSWMEKTIIKYMSDFRSNDVRTYNCPSGTNKLFRYSSSKLADFGDLFRHCSLSSEQELSSLLLITRSSYFLL